MNTTPYSSEYDENNIGETACGSRVMITTDTPFIRYRDETIFFCAEDCKFLYDEEPLNSCMAARILSGK